MHFDQQLALGEFLIYWPIFLVREGDRWHAASNVHPSALFVWNIKLVGHGAEDPSVMSLKYAISMVQRSRPPPIIDVNAVH